MEMKTKNLSPAQEAPESQFSGETIGSLMAECAELTQQIESEKDRLERFMLETGGASDASDRIQANIDSLQSTLEAAENRLQMLFDAQEREAFAPEKKPADRQKNTKERTSVIRKLAEIKEEIKMGKHNDVTKERKSPNRGMEK